MTESPSHAHAGNASSQKAVFTEGSTLRHVIVMTLTAAVGLIAVFFVDAITLFYISLLNDPLQTAAVGRASYLLAFPIGISVGMMIGTSVVVARAVGAGEREVARRAAGAALVAVALVGSSFTVILMVLQSWFLTMLNAEGESLTLASNYLLITLPGMPFLMMGMACMGILRAIGDARRSMLITLVGAIILAVLDPILIFVFNLEIYGAAIASLIVRISFTALGLSFVLKTHNMARLGQVKNMLLDLRKIVQIAVPAIFTNLATPVGAFLIAQQVALFGDDAMAGLAVADRIAPVVFGLVFSLSGAVGPIIGQNIGAKNVGRARQAFIDGQIFNLAYVLPLWLGLFLAQDLLVSLYSASGEAAVMIRLWATYLVGAFLFNGMLFVTNAAFNNMDRPFWATALNWSRWTVGLIPFVWLGAQWDGLQGIALGVLIGGIPFSVIAIWLAWRLFAAVEKTYAAEAEQPQQAQ